MFTYELLFNSELVPTECVGPKNKINTVIIQKATCSRHDIAEKLFIGQ